MKKFLKSIVIGAIAVAGLWFIVSSLSESAESPEVAESPDLQEVPLRAYGIIEPAGREVYVTSSISRPVSGIYVDEGDTVNAGQIILQLENELETARLDAALSRKEAVQKELEIRTYDYDRKRSLFLKKAIAEYDYEMARLEMELGSTRLEVAGKEIRLAREQLQQLELRSPIEGIVYKLDVRLGELFPGNDNTRVVLGSTDLWVRLFVESFWRDRFAIGVRCRIFDPETTDFIGWGKVISTSRYLTDRNFRTEDVMERFDAEFEQVVLELEKGDTMIPLGLNVLAVIDGEEGKTSNDR
jgi:hypothetical protein